MALAEAAKRTPYPWLHSEINVQLTSKTVPARYMAGVILKNRSQPGIWLGFPSHEALNIFRSRVVLGGYMHISDVVEMYWETIHTHTI